MVTSMKKGLVADSNNIKLAMLGMVEGNGHPYSWSAIINGGYDKDKIAKCPYPAINDYLSKQPPETLGIPGVKVTHIWTDNPADAVDVAAASLIPNIVEEPEDVIGKVDAVIIATDIGSEHVGRCKPFVEAGIPIFVDKPLVDNTEDLRKFMEWVNSGKNIMSSSCMRYAKEFMPYQISTNEFGNLRYLSITTPKSWERYGIHALEAIYPILGGGFVSVRNTGSEERNIVHLKHGRGIDIIVVANKDMYGAFGVLTICGTAGHVCVSFRDTFYAFKKQLEEFITFLRTGIRSFPFEETCELMKMVIAGIISRNEGGREVRLEEIV